MLPPSKRINSDDEDDMFAFTAEENEGDPLDPNRSNPTEDHQRRTVKRINTTEIEKIEDPNGELYFPTLVVLMESRILKFRI